MEEAKLAEFIIEWIWVPVIAGMAGLLKMLLALMTRVSKAETAVELNERIMTTALKQQGEISAKIDQHNKTVLQLINDQQERFDKRETDQQASMDRRHEALEAAVRDAIKTAASNNR